MPGRIGVDLEVVGSGILAGGLQDNGTEFYDSFVCGSEVIHPEVQVNLLLWHAVGPFWRYVVGRKLHSDLRFAVNHDHVPVIIDIDDTVEHTGPERALAP